MPTPIVVDLSHCTLWTGATVRGYGVRNMRGKVRYVHRMVCEAVHGTPPTPQHMALHLCNQPLCYNPDHLYWGTKKQNAEDSRAAGTMALGEKHGMVKLTEKKVRAIRAASGSSYVIAAKFGVAASTVRSIRNPKGNWRWLR